MARASLFANKKKLHFKVAFETFQHPLHDVAKRVANKSPMMPVNFIFFSFLSLRSSISILAVSKFQPRLSTYHFFIYDSCFFKYYLFILFYIICQNSFSILSPLFFYSHRHGLQFFIDIVLFFIIF